MVSKVVSDYRLSEELGHGNFGWVYKGVNLKTGEIAAVKAIDKNSLTPKMQELLATEIQALTNINSDSVVRFKKMCKSGTTYYIIMDYCSGGNLEELLSSSSYISSELILRWSTQLLSALFAFQSNHILHRDLKPANILLTSRNLREADIKVCDLGLARVLSGDMLATTQVGTPLTSAPEILTGQPYDFKVDLWSFGVILYQLSHKKPPFPARTFQELLQMQRTLPIFNTEIDIKLKALIMDLLAYYPNQRPNLEQISKYAYFTYSTPLREDIDLNQATSSIGHSRPTIREYSDLSSYFLTKNRSISSYLNHQILKNTPRIHYIQEQLKSLKSFTSLEKAYLELEEIIERARNSKENEERWSSEEVVSEAEEMLVAAMRLITTNAEKKRLLRWAEILLSEVEGDADRVRSDLDLCVFCQNRLID